MTPGTVVVGLDLSLSSPGVCVYVDGVYRLFYFSQRKRGESQETVAGGIVLERLGPIPGPERDDAERYHYIASSITRVVTGFARACTTTCVEVYIEHYAFSKSSAHSFKLHELGGVVKQMLWQLSRDLSGVDIQTQMVAIGQWKKRMCGNGHATKQDVCTYIRDVHPRVDLLAMCGLRCTASGDVPNPVQDISDAMGIVLSRVHPYKKPARTVDSTPRSNKKQCRRDTR